MNKYGTIFPTGCSVVSGDVTSWKQMRGGGDCRERKNSLASKRIRFYLCHCYSGPIQQWGSNLNQDANTGSHKLGVPLLDTWYELPVSRFAEVLSFHSCS